MTRAEPPARARIRLFAAAARVMLGAMGLAVFAAAPSRLFAQGVLTGRVTGPGGEPVPAALVRLTAASGDGFRVARSAADGRYQVAFPGDGARFSLWVERLGYEPATSVVDRTGAGAIRDVRLAARATQLAGVEARVAANPVSRERTGPGGRATATRGSGNEMLPLEPGDLSQFAAMTRGAVPSGGDGAFSLRGMAPSQNRTVVDGASSATATLPAEAVRAVGVVSSAYDVSRGQFTGGQIAATTQSGTNFPGGAMSLRMQGSQWMQMSGGYGGALRRDRLFAFAALQAWWRDAPFESLSDADDNALRRLGLSGDSVRRFGEVLGRIGGPASAARGTSSAFGSGLLRLDWRPSETHTLTARLDARTSHAAGAASQLGWTGTGGTRRTADGGLLLAWTSRWAGDATQELRAYASTGTSRARPFLDGPGGRVRVASGDAGEALLEFGGESWVSSSGRRSLLELSDDVVLPLRGGASQLRFGGTLAREHTSLDGTADAMGSFVFNSLADLEAGTPAEFTRTLSSPHRAASADYLGAYLGHRVQATRGLSFGYGVRLDAMRYADGDGITEAAGLQPGRVPGETSLSPRLGFTWEMGKDAALRGGVGRFVGRVPLTSLAGALAEDGTQQPRLVCTGPAAPRPDWAAYAADPAAVPTACASGAPSFAHAAPAVTAFAPGFRAPRAWRGSLELDWNPTDRWIVNLQASLARGSGVPLAFDRNLDRSAAFALEGEAGRPVFVPLAEIDPASGAVSASASRLDPAYAAAREVTADGRSGAGQLTASVSRRWRGVIVGGWYTWTDAWNEATGTAAPGGWSGGTAGDPWTIDRAPADYARRHALSVTGTAELGHGMTLGFIGRLLSGLPYTPWVDGDANGDGVANDRAFVFGAAAPAEVRAGMDRLLDDAPAGARECLRHQRDRIAERNSCRGPWMTTLDAQLAFAPGGTSRRVRVSLTASNLPGVLDQVVHGSDELRGWGQPTTPDPVLLYVRGFDPAARAFRYQVNPGFGKRTAGAGLPFTLTLQVRVRAGSDPARQWMAEAVRASRRYGRRPSEIAAALATAIPNLPALALAAAKSGECELTAAERDSLQRRADATQVEIDAVIALLAQAASAADTTARPDALEPVRQLTARARSIMAEDLSAIRQVLGPQKWERLPARFREPLGFAPLVPPRGIIIETPDP